MLLKQITSAGKRLISINPKCYTNCEVRKVDVMHVTYFVCCKSPVWNWILCAAFTDTCCL